MSANYAPLMATVQSAAFSSLIFIASCVEDIQYDTIKKSSDELSRKLTKVLLPIIQSTQIFYSLFRFRNTAYVINPGYMNSIKVPVFTQKNLVLSTPVIYGLLYYFNSKKTQKEASIFKKIELNLIVNLVNVISGIAILFFSNSYSKIQECIITLPSVCLVAKKIFYPRAN